MELLIAIALGLIAYLAFRQQRVARDDNNATVNDLDSVWESLGLAHDRLDGLEKANKKPAKKRGA